MRPRDGYNLIQGGRASGQHGHLPITPFLNTGLITPPPLMTVPTGYVRMSQAGIPAPLYPQGSFMEVENKNWRQKTIEEQVREAWDNIRAENQAKGNQMNVESFGWQGKEAGRQAAANLAASFAQPAIPARMNIPVQPMIRPPPPLQPVENPLQVNPFDFDVPADRLNLFDSKAGQQKAAELAATFATNVDMLPKSAQSAPASSLNMFAPKKMDDVLVIEQKSGPDENKYEDEPLDTRFGREFPVGGALKLIDREEEPFESSKKRRTKETPKPAPFRRDYLVIESTRRREKSSDEMPSVGSMIDAAISLTRKQVPRQSEIPVIQIPREFVESKEEDQLALLPSIEDVVADVGAAQALVTMKKRKKSKAPKNRPSKVPKVTDPDPYATEDELDGEEHPFL